MNNYKYLIIFVNHFCHLISAKRCLHYRGTVVQKHLAIGQGVKILGQKNRGGVQRTPPPCQFKG